jgi:hypothetical protein
MENVAGEDLSWFWRGWVLNNWQLDQSVKGVAYIDNDAKKGAEVTIQNLGKMAMPVPVFIKESNGKVHRFTLPVEIWQRGSQWTFAVPTTSRITEVVLDPEKKLPDVHRNNNAGNKKAF